MSRCRFHHATRTALTVAGTLALSPNVSGCAVDTACAETAGTHAESIKLAGGSLGETRDIEPVLVAVLIERPGGASLICSGTRVAPGVALTAAHCVRDVALDELRVRSAESQALAREVTSGEGCGASNRASVEPSRVRAVARHEELDLAALHFDDASPLAAARTGKTPALEGPATIAGFGTTETLERGALRAIDVDVLAVGPRWITVQARGGGACTGDSGGPLYTLDAAQVTVHGVLSRGSASCYGRDDYVPVAAATEWLDSLLEP